MARVSEEKQFADLRVGQKFKRAGERAVYLKIKPCFTNFGCREVMEITAVRIDDGSVWNIQNDTEVIFEEVL